MRTEQYKTNTWQQQSNLKRTDMETFQERRKHKRFIVKNRSAVLVLPTTILSYAVLDISNSGLAFSYTGCENWPTKPMKRIKLYILDREFFLDDIQISVIDDVRIAYGSNELRRYGLKFTSLDKGQKTILRRYIASVAID
jgi:c-di-GMP-binding flagellar brake protein YcgR